MADTQDGMVGSYRPKSDISTHPYGEPPPYPGKGSADYEVRIAPAKDEILRNGETTENGIAPTDTDERCDFILALVLAQNVPSLASWHHLAF